MRGIKEVTYVFIGASQWSTVKEQWLFPIINMPSATSWGPGHRWKKTKGQRARQWVKAALPSWLQRLRADAVCAVPSGLARLVSPSLALPPSETFQGLPGARVPALGSPHREPHSTGPSGAARGRASAAAAGGARSSPSWAGARARSRATDDCPRPAKVVQVKERFQALLR